MKNPIPNWVIYLWLTLGFLFWAGIIALAFAQTAKSNPNVWHPNPEYVPRIMVCSNYDSHCGRYFKRVLALYDYRVCQHVESNVCQTWYTPEELHLIFNALPGWED